MSRRYPSMVAPHATFGQPAQPGALPSRDDTAGLDPLPLSEAIRSRSASPAPSGQGVSGGWQIEDGKPISEAPYACHVLAGRLNEDTGDWIMAVVASPPIRPFTHWWPLPGQLAAPAPSCAPGEVREVELITRWVNDAIKKADARDSAESVTLFARQWRIVAAALSPQGLDAATVECTASHCEGYGPWNVLARHGDSVWIVHHDERGMATYRSVDRADLVATEPHQHGGKGA